MRQLIVLFFLLCASFAPTPGWGLDTHDTRDAHDTDLQAPSRSESNESQSNKWLDIRIRPFALLQAVEGVELGVIVNPRLEIGPTIHYLSNGNDVRGSSVKSWEFALKATYLFYKAAPHEGAYVSLGFYEYRTDVDQIVSTTETTTSGYFNTPGVDFTVGYQWDLGLFSSDAWTLRLGGGIGYKQEHDEYPIVDGTPYPIGVRERLDPTLEFTFGVIF